MPAINSSYSVNITITIGTDFSQWFYLTFSDSTPVDLTTAEFFAVISKHSESVDAVLSTSDNPVWNCIPVDVDVINATDGIYALTIAKERLVSLSEGKFIYVIVARDTTDDTIVKLVNGLVFIDSLPRVFVSGILPSTPIPSPPMTPPTVGVDGELQDLDSIIDAINNDSSFLF